MIVAWLSRTVGVTEPALRLLISVLIGEFRFQFTFNSGSSLSKEENFLLIFFLLIFRNFSPLVLLTAYPIVICYRCFLHNNNSFTKKHTNLLFAVCGILICVFNYGFEVYHSLFAVTFTYAIINLMYGSRYLVPVSFLFHMSYLLIGN